MHLLAQAQALVMKLNLYREKNVKPSIAKEPRCSETPSSANIHTLYALEVLSKEAKISAAIISFRKIVGTQ